jgi:hypothetical protein
MNKESPIQLSKQTLEQEQIAYFLPSLAKSRGFMQVIAEQPQTNTNGLELDRELRYSTDTATWMAELLYGSMRTSFDFNYDGSVLRGEDGGSMDEVFETSIREAQIIAYTNPGLMFELRRRLVEGEELDDMKAMVRGELLTDDGEQANTIVVLSDFPAELMQTTEDVGGYNARRKQAMLRIITLEEDGSLKVTTQSLDGSNREALEAISLALGKQAEDGELLSQRINLNFTADGQSRLANNLTDIYDESLTQQFGGRWHAGIKQPDQRAYVNTYEFSCQQTDLIDLFTQAKMTDSKAAEMLRYKLAATVSARYEQYINKQTSANIRLGTIPPQAFVTVRGIKSSYRSLEHELEVYSRRAAARGDIFSGCGVTTTSDESVVDAQLRQLGYGNESAYNSDEECEFVSEECPQCGAEKVITKVTKTHITGSCGCSKKIEQPALSYN